MPGFSCPTAAGDGGECEAVWCVVLSVGDRGPGTEALNVV